MIVLNVRTSFKRGCLRYLLLTVLTIVSSVITAAQNEYIGINESIVQTLKSQNIVSVKNSVDSIYVSSELPNSIRWVKDSTGEVRFIGFDIFTNQARDKYNSSLNNFIERELLELYLTRQDSKEVNQIIDRDNLHLELNGIDFVEGPFWNVEELFSVINQSSEVNFSSDRSRWFVTWQQENGNRFSISFPLNKQVIQGKDKRELDVVFFDELFDKTRWVRRRSNDTLAIDKLEKIESNVYKLPGIAYEIESVNSDCFYYKKDQKHELIFSPENPLESFINIFVSDLKLSEPITLKIKQDVYTGENKLRTVSVSDFINAYQGRYQPFVGVEKESKSHLIISLYLLDDFQGVLHVCQMKCSEKSLFHSKEIYAKIRTNIPLDNVDTIYGKEKTRENSHQKRYTIRIQK